MPDMLSLSGATELARRIEAFWAAKGAKVEARIEAFTMPGQDGSLKGTLYSVRSDMIGGSPKP